MQVGQLQYFIMIRFIFFKKKKKNPIVYTNQTFIENWKSQPYISNNQLPLLCVYGTSVYLYTNTKQ